tara:strand:+ start:193 stop:447 length:255 start_codon:yes stop_codon:yes gene_type:complete
LGKGLIPTSLITKLAVKCFPSVSPKTKGPDVRVICAPAISKFNGGSSNKKRQHAGEGGVGVFGVTQIIGRQSVPVIIVYAATQQ